VVAGSAGSLGKASGSPVMPFGYCRVHASDYPFLTWAPAAWLLVLLALMAHRHADSPQFSVLAAIYIAPQEFIAFITWP